MVTGMSPIAMRAIVALLKMGLRRITYLVSANDETNADIFGSCLCPVAQTLVALSYQKDCHETIQCFLRSRTLNATCFLAETVFSNVSETQLANLIYFLIFP